MSPDIKTEQSTQTMTIIGGEQQFQKWSGPYRESARFLEKHAGEFESYSMYFVRTKHNTIYLCYFDEVNLNFRSVIYPFEDRYGHGVHDVVAFSSCYKTLEKFEKSGLLPNERAVNSELPELPSKEYRIERLRYNHLSSVVVIGIFRYPDDRAYVSPCAFLDEDLWVNPMLNDMECNPDGWCYVNDLLVPVDL